MDTNRPVILALLEALVDAWLETMDPEDVRQDLAKINILTDAFNKLPHREEIPERIGTFYDGVFLRDLWSTRNQD